MDSFSFFSKAPRIEFQKFLFFLYFFPYLVISRILSCIFPQKAQRFRVMILRSFESSYSRGKCQWPLKVSANHKIIKSIDNKKSKNLVSKNWFSFFSNLWIIDTLGLLSYLQKGYDRALYLRLHELKVLSKLTWKGCSQRWWNCGKSVDVNEYWQESFWWIWLRKNCSSSAMCSTYDKTGRSLINYQAQ